MAFAQSEAPRSSARALPRLVGQEKPQACAEHCPRLGWSRSSWGRPLLRLGRSQNRLVWLQPSAPASSQTGARRGEQATFGCLNPDLSRDADPLLLASQAGAGCRDSVVTAGSGQLQVASSSGLGAGRRGSHARERPLAAWNNGTSDQEQATCGQGSKPVLGGPMCSLRRQGSRASSRSHHT